MTNTSNWKEAYHNLDPMEPLRPDDARLYPELFGNFVDDIAEKIVLNKDKNIKLLLSGHIDVSTINTILHGGLDKCCPLL